MAARSQAVRATLRATEQVDHACFTTGCGKLDRAEHIHIAAGSHRRWLSGVPQERGVTGAATGVCATTRVDDAIMAIEQRVCGRRCEFLERTASKW